MTLQEELRDNKGHSGEDSMRNDAADMLDQYQKSHDEWIKKTEWAQGAPWAVQYLGMHRADGIKARMDELEALLREAVYALDYAADMTKPDDMQGCDCPICTVGRKIDEALK